MDYEYYAEEVAEHNETLEELCEQAESGIIDEESIISEVESFNEFYN